MAITMIPDDDLLAAPDIMTVCVCTPDAPTDIWSLAEAVAQVVRQPDARRITLFRPPGAGMRAAWMGYEPIERLAGVLGMEAASAAEA